MTWLDEFGKLSAVVWAILFSFTFQGSDCELVVFHAGPTQVNASAGSSVTLAVSFTGATDPVVTWFMEDLPVVTWTMANGSPPDIAPNTRGVLKIDRSGSLTFVNVTRNYTSNYTIEITKSGLATASIKFTLTVFERPSSNPECSVQSVDNVSLQYNCLWSGGNPLAQLSFPALNNSSSGKGNFSLIVPASDNLNMKTVTCLADHPTEQNKCDITARSPMEFLPTVRTTVDFEGKIVVIIHCFSEASPRAVVSWSNDSRAVPVGTTYQISHNTTQLEIRDYNVSNFLLQNYTCTCRNLLGSQRRDIQLRGPSISDSSLIRNQDGTIITLTWEVPPTSIVTGFDIKMKGPNFLSKHRNGAQTRGSSDGFRTIQQKPGSARSTDVFALDPDLRYMFRIIPKARMTEGAPSEDLRIGPGDGLSGPAIAGIAAGIPCSLLFLLLLGGSIYLCVYCNKNKSRQTRYPVSRAVEKVITTQTDAAPHNLLTGELKSPPDYNRLQQTPSERSVALPTFVPPPPVRVATTV